MKSKATVIVAILAVVMATLPSFVRAQGMEVTSAKVYLQNNNKEKAEEFLLKALEKDPNHKDAHFYMGLLDFYKGSYESMLAHWDKFDSKDLGKVEKKQYDSTIKNLFRDSFNKGVKLFSEQNWDGAASNFRVAMRVNPIPKDYLVNVNLGSALMNGEKTDEAIEVMEKVAAVDPKNPIVWDILSLGYIRKSDYPNIIKAYTNYVMLTDKPDKVAYYQIARAYFATGDTLKAADTYESGMVKIPDEMDFYVQASAIRSQFGQNDQSAQILERARKIDPTNPQVLYSLGTIYYILKQYQKAVDPLEAFLQLEPKSIDGWDTLGNAYFGLAKVSKDQGDMAKVTEYETKGQEYIGKSKELLQSGEGK